MRTDRLGVGIGDLTADERHAAQLDADVGLEVASIEPGSVASKIGLEVGDVIVEVNGRVVHGAPDVLETLAQRKSDQDIVVTIVDQDHKKRTLTWRAPSAPAEKPAREKREY
jgi:serine protease Do